MNDALRSKAPEGGQNLLADAAAQGSNDWFLYITGEIIRSKVSPKSKFKSGNQTAMHCATLRNVPNASFLRTPRLAIQRVCQEHLRWVQTKCAGRRDVQHRGIA